jgi:hypothetical protein
MGQVSPRSAALRYGSQSLCFGRRAMGMNMLVMPGLVPGIHDFKQVRSKGVLALAY